MRKYLTVLVFSLFAAACGNNSKISDYGECFQKIIKNDSGTFRGISLEDHIQKINFAEKIKLLEGDSAYLLYEETLDSSDTYTVEYRFEKNKLTEIRLDVYVKDLEKWKALFEDFREYYNKKCGDCTREQDSFVWKINNRTITIVLTDESTDYKEGNLSLAIYYESFPS